MMRFKSPELEPEFNKAHPRVQALALWLDRHASLTFNKDLMVTSVARTLEEYERIYGPGFSGPMPHLSDPAKGIVSRAVDFRTVGELEGEEVACLVTLTNVYWKRTDGKPTALWHTVGAGLHLHCQVEA